MPRAGLVAAVALSCGLACSPGRTRSSALGLESSSPVRAGEAVASASLPWRFHPQEKAPTTASRRWGDGSLLELDEAGCRWLRRAGQAPEVSPYGAPEPLIGFVEEGDRVAAVGERGNVYFLGEPLGPWREVRTPESLLGHAVVSGGGIYGVTQGGDGVVSQDAGRSFRRLQHDGVLIDLASSKTHGIVFVAAPERWFSIDEGEVHPQLLDLQTIAPLRLETNPEGELVAVALHGPRVLSADGWTEHEQAVSAKAPARSENEYELPEYARSTPVHLGHALQGRGHYFGLKRLDAKRFRLQQGSVGGALQVSEVPAPDQCLQWKLIGAAQRPVLLCALESEPQSSLVAVAPWQEDRQRFVPLERVLRGAFSQLAGDVSPRHDQRNHRDESEVVLQGVCPPHASETGCSPEGLLVVPLQANAKLRHVALPERSEVLAVRLSAAGTLHVLVERTDDRHLVLERFGRDSVLPRATDLTEVEDQLRRDRSGAVKLNVDESGNVSVVAQRRLGTVLISLDAWGRVLSTTRAPHGVEQLEARGRHVAGLDSQADVLWTSTDFGASFSREVLPRPLCASGDRDCASRLACDGAACLVGDELVRLGYDPVTSRPPTIQPPASSQSVDGSALPSIVCSASETEWQRLEGLAGVPGAADAWLGETTWTSVALDQATAAVDAVLVRSTSSQVERHTLLPPVPDPEHHALTITPQVEGSVALRARLIAGRRHAAGTVELGWDNRIENQLVTTSLPVGIGEVPTMSTSARSRRANPALLSIGGRGVHVQLEPRGPTVFVEPPAQLGTARVLPVEQATWPLIDPELDPRLPGLLAGAREERVVVGGERSALLLLGDNRIAVWTHSVDGNRRTTPILLGPLEGTAPGPRSGVRLAYQGREIGFVSLIAAMEGQPISAEFVGLSPNGGFSRPIAVPLLDDLPRVPEPCSASARAGTPRILAPELGGTRRDVDVRGLDGGLWTMSSDDAVLFGTRESPCLAGYEAASSTRERVTLHALVSPFGGATSWLFSEERSLTGESTIRAQAMRCEFEPETSR